MRVQDARDPSRKRPARLRCLGAITGSRAAALDLPDFQESQPYPVILSAR